MFFSNSYVGKNQWWRYLLFIVVVPLSSIIGQIPMLIAIYVQKDRLKLSESEFEEIWISSNLEALQFTENQILTFILLSFVSLFITMAILTRILHKKRFLTIITGRKKFDWGRTLTGFCIWMGLAIIVIFLLLPSDNYTYQFNWVTFIPLLIISLMLFPIQVASEEIFIRGYLMQGIFLISKNKIVPLVVTALLFALMHLTNPEFQNGFLKVMPAYLLLSFMFGAITVLDDGLELPIGIHLANNLFVALILSTSDGSVKTPSLFRTEVSALFDTLSIAFPIIIITTLILLSRKYQWKSSTLLEKV